MGMDVYGKKNPEAYFRASVWTWHPLWDVCCLVSPELTDQVTHGHSNVGDGLNEADSIRLANRLLTALASGDVARIIETELRRQSQLVDDDCTYCQKTGRRQWPEGERECNVCQGRGHHRPDDTHHHTTTEEVRRFIVFLDTCGGFEIR